MIDQLNNLRGGATLTSISEFSAPQRKPPTPSLAAFRKVDAMLHSTSVHFVLVTTSEGDRLREADALVHQMDAAGLRLSAIVLNRMLNQRTFDALLTEPRRLPIISRRSRRYGAS